MDSSRPALKGFIPQDFEYSHSAMISPKKTNRFEKFINCCAFLVLSPFWAVFSIVAEVTAIPFQLTLNTLKHCGNNGFTLGFCIIISPVIFTGFCIFTTVFTPISFMMKIYACIRAEDFSDGMKCLVYPTSHPIYGNYLKPAQTVELGKTLFISAAETSTTYDPPKMSFGREEISSLDWDFEKDQAGDYLVKK